MEKFQEKTFRVIAILFMLSTAPFAVSYSYAENEKKSEPEIQNFPNSSSKFQKGESGELLAEKVGGGNIVEKQGVFPENTINDDMNRSLSFGGASGRSYFDYLGYHSGIVIFDGKTSKGDEKGWKFSVDGTLNLSKGEFGLKLLGKSYTSNPKTTEDLSNEDLGYRVIFSGKMIDSDEKSEFAIALMSSQKNSDTAPNIKFLQFWNPISEAVNSLDGKQKVGNSIF